ncbi:hypothetical protein I4F81_009351 [Pyropia yezoensis]|uniref:Uncharacterized protein n=1 Tax=Pyropia yezoensis TaxID=2788 RepID=A0ACC3C958_PYRYE|nr:hypothetical protein I4F81_009351 [Neopyropia yezoensis]
MKKYFLNASSARRSQQDYIARRALWCYGNAKCVKRVKEVLGERPKTDKRLDSREVWSNEDFFAPAMDVDKVKPAARSLMLNMALEWTGVPDERGRATSAPELAAAAARVGRIYPFRRQ